MVIRVTTLHTSLTATSTETVPAREHGRRSRLHQESPEPLPVGERLRAPLPSRDLYR